MKLDKPSQGIYQCLLDRLHKHVSPTIHKEDVIFVDDKEENVKAAEAFGFKGITFDRHSESASVLQHKLKELGMDV